MNKSKRNNKLHCTIFINLKQEVNLIQKFTF